jgi:hypothetical protein
VFLLAAVIRKKVQTVQGAFALYLTPYLTQALFSPFGKDAAGREGNIWYL